MIYILVFLFGLVIGSFLNHVIYRISLENYSLYKDLFSFKNRSYCPSCKHVLNWMDLFPIFSFIFLKGKCRYCHKKISVQYPLVEILTGFVFLLVYIYKFTYGDSIIALILLFYIVSSLIVIFIYDLKHYIIPDQILFPAIAVAFAYQFIFDYNSLFFNYISAATMASLFFAAIFFISRGTWIGFGDVKLAILLGLILGYPAILVGMFLAFLFGAIIGIIIILLGKKGLKSEIPFAPFLITGTFVAMLFGRDIISWYLSFFYF